MILKTLSNKDIALIKKALKNLLKTQLLNEETLSRLDWLLSTISEDEKHSIIDTLFKDMQSLSSKEIEATDYDESIH